MINKQVFFRIVFVLFFAVCLLQAQDGRFSVRLKQAAEYANQNKYTEALEEYKAVLVSDKNNAEAYLGAGNVRFKMKEYQRALDNFKLAQKNNPKLTEAIEGEAKSYEALNQKNNAISKWRVLAESGSAEQKTRALAKIGELLGTTKTTSENTSKTVATKNSSSKFTYDSPEFKAGLVAYEQKKWAESSKHWRDVLKKEPGNPGAYYYAGIARFNMGEPDNAIINFNRSFDYPEKGFNAYYYLGRIYEQKNDKAKAVSNYNKYLQLTSSKDGKTEVEERIAKLNAGTSKNNANNIAVSSSFQEQKSSASYECNSLESCLKMEEKRKQDSIAAYLESLKNKPLTIGPEKIVQTEYGGNFVFASATEAGSADLQKSLNLIQKKSFQSAIDALQVVRQKFPATPNSVAAAYNLLSLYQYLELNDKVIALGNSILQEPIPEPYKSAISYILASSQVKKEDYQNAFNTISDIKEDQKLGPTLGQKLSLEAEIAAKYKPDQGSPEILRKAIDAESDRVKKNELRLKLADLYSKLQDAPAAMQTYKEIAENCPANTTDPCYKAVYELGDRSYLAQNWPMALEYYNKAIEQHKDPAFVSWALFQIGNVFRKQGNYKEAVRFYERLIKEYGSTYWADQAKLYKDDAIWQDSNKGVLKK